MKNTFGESVSVTVFGESHGSCIGAVLDGMAPGIEIDTEFIKLQLNLRRASAEISTSRKESDEFEIISGVFKEKTTGTPICIIIKNSDTHSSDYENIKNLMRPGHADYTAQCKYHGYQDYRGGGHFSGRVTAGLVAVGAIAIKALRTKNIYIGTHISRCAGILDTEFTDIDCETLLIADKMFPVIDDKSGEKMQQAILEAKSDSDSVGGILQTAVTGIPAGIGEPVFDSMEGMLSHALFSIPAIKGIEFGAGFDIADMRASSANDQLYVCDNGISTYTNNNGGINGGITNGMPIVFSCAVKPTPSISKTQKTVDISTMTNADINIHGRHDPAIIHRARAVVNAMTAIVICDALAQRFGTDYLGEKI